MWIRSTRECGSGLICFGCQPMKHCIFHDPAALEMLDDDSLEQLRRDSAIPNAFGINDNDWSALAHTEAWSLAPLHTSRTKEQSFALQQRCKKRIQRATAALGRAVASGADDDVPRVRFHRPW